MRKDRLITQVERDQLKARARALEKLWVPADVPAGYLIVSNEAIQLTPGELLDILQMRGEA